MCFGWSNNVCRGAAPSTPPGRIWNAPLLFFFYYVCYNVFTCFERIHLCFTINTSRWPSRVYCAGLALLLVLSEVFSSNVQDTLPGFSRIMRLGLTGCAVLLLAGKIILLTGYEARWQKVLIAVVLVYTAFSSWYGGDLWFFLAALIGLGAKDVDWETALRVYLVTAVAGLVLVQALHFATPLMPYKFYCRNWDFGYGHYNGFGARLVGVFFAWGVAAA